MAYRNSLLNRLSIVHGGKILTIIIIIIIIIIMLRNLTETKLFIKVNNWQLADAGVGRFE